MSKSFPWCLNHSSSAALTIFVLMAEGIRPSFLPTFMMYVLSFSVSSCVRVMLSLSGFASFFFAIWLTPLLHTAHGVFMFYGKKKTEGFMSQPLALP